MSEAITHEVMVTLRDAEHAWAAGAPIHDDRQANGNAEAEDNIPF